MRSHNVSFSLCIFW